MSNRRLKQFIYIAGYLVVFVFLFFGTYYIWFRPAPSCFDNRQNQGETGVDCGGPCIPCAIKKAVPLQTDWLKYFPAGSQTLIAARIQNPNVALAVSRMTYTLNVFDKDGNLLKSVSRDSLIYAGEIKYILEVVDVDSKNIDSSKIDYSAINWLTKDDFSTPNIQTRAVKTDTPAGAAGPEVDGFVANQNPFGLSKARIIAFLYNSTNLEIAVSKTELDNMNAFEERAFHINFPSNIPLLTAASSSPAFTFTRNLSIGSKSNDVAELQKFLKDKGLWDRDITNHFGSLLAKALAQYQKQNSISPATGSLNQKTIAVVNAALARSAALVAQNNLKAADPAKTKIYVEAIR